jgi:hypothetical protein
LAPRQGEPPREGFWSVVLFALLCSELYSINQEQKEHRREQEIVLCEQNNRFGQIAQKLENDIRENREHFDKTMEAEKFNLEQEKVVAVLAKSSLENITGGESFAFARPVLTTTNNSNLVVENAGDQVLTGLHIVIERIMNGCSIEPGAKCIQLFDDGSMHPIELGTLAPHRTTSLSRLIPFDSIGNGTGHYNVRIYAQNGQAVEELWFRRSSVHFGFAYKFKVMRAVGGKPKKDDFQFHDVYWHILKSTDWTEYSPNESRDGIHPYVPQ